MLLYNLHSVKGGWGEGVGRWIDEGWIDESGSGVKGDNAR